MPQCLCPLGYLGTHCEKKGNIDGKYSLWSTLIFFGACSFYSLISITDNRIATFSLEHIMNRFPTNVLNGWWLCCSFYHVWLKFAGVCKNKA